MPVLKKELKSLPLHNKEQQQAITSGAGPMLILAGPGSGKTYVITHRILHLISQCHIPPDQILVITFTKAAALEMQKRATSLYHPCSYVQFGTFHSVFYHILKLSNPNRQFQFASDEERIELIYQVLKENSAEENKDSYQDAENCLKAISRLKNQFFKDNQKETKDTYELPKEYERACGIYEAWLSENDKLDFDDMIKLCYEQLYKNPQMRTYWQKRFSYILIDEFQDINPIQYETVKLLCQNRQIFCVGDDDQAIYGFRGSDPNLMKEFLCDFNGKVIQLSFNYRSGQKIVNTATEFISHNQNRFPKRILAAKEHQGEVLIVKGPDRLWEADYLQKEIQQYALKYPKKTQAILTRTNDLYSLYEPIIGRKSTSPLWPDLKAYLLFINGKRQRKDFLYIMNKPTRYISRSLLAEDTVDFNLLRKRLKNQPWIERRVAKLEEQVEFVKNLHIQGQLHYIWNIMGYKNYAVENYGKYQRNKEKAQWDFKELWNMAKNHTDYDKFIKAVEDKDKIDTNEKHQLPLQLMTYHGAKGLEFDRVYLPDLNYGKVPHGKMLTKEELEEERRMFYVAMTRAKESLVLVYDQTQTGSPFLEELFL